jgi:hypothetical protein
MHVDPSETKKFGVYIAVVIGDNTHIRTLERDGKDLVGGLLVQHIARMLVENRLAFGQAVLVTDGFRGRALKSFVRKGFKRLPVANPYGYPVLELDATESPAEAFLLAIQRAIEHSEAGTRSHN